MSYSGTARDLKRGIEGAKVQDEMRKNFKRKVDKLKRDTDAQINKMKLANMFSKEKGTYEQTFRASIIGLQTQKQFLEKRQLAIDADYNESKTTKKNRKAKIEKSKKRNLLTFVTSDNEEEDTNIFLVNPKRSKKNPMIDTSFLPDQARDLADEQLREDLRKEFMSLQKKLKKSILEITFSFWDGSNHRRTMQVERGSLIIDFLEIARKELEKNFVDLRGLNGNSLMFIKDDLIIGHNYSFQELIISKARKGNKQELFILEEWENVENNEICYKDNGIQGKVVTRTWYERNKHIYPGNKWVIYDPSLHSHIEF